MRSVSLAAAKAGLSALLDAVEAGEEVRITRRGKTVARLVPDHSTSEVAPQAWAERLKRFQQELPALSSSGVALVRALREES
jgi:prevent-host-death family protein